MPTPFRSSRILQEAWVFGVDMGQCIIPFIFRSNLVLSEFDVEAYLKLNPFSWWFLVSWCLGGKISYFN